MKETKFIAQNKKKWQEFEELSESRHKDSNLYSKLFIQITDDLSYARTFYSNRSVRVYLNHLAQNIFHKVFSRNRKKQSFIRDFWMEELPSIMYHHRIELLVSFVVLLIAIALGLLTYEQDPAFAEKILGDSYVSMTAENIAKKDPMAVYKQSAPIEMFVRIALNNLFVDIRTFFSGLFFSVGTILVILYNGLMLSAFQYYFIKQDLFRESFLAVWLHGTLEISAMVICGAAGLVLGKGLVFPGTYSRTQAFFSSAQRATKIFFSVLPLTITAAVIESFLTRYTNAPDSLRLLLILVSLFFILGYYVYLPWLKKRNGTLRIPEAEKVLPESFRPFDFFQIRKVSEIILDTFRIFRKHTGFFMGSIFISVLVFMAVGITLNKKYLLDGIFYTQDVESNLKLFFVADTTNWFTLLIPAELSLIALRVCYVFHLEQWEQLGEKIGSFSSWLKQHAKPIFLVLMIQVLFYAVYSFYKLDYYVLLFVLPLQFIGVFAIFFPFTDNPGTFRSFYKTLKGGLFTLFTINLSFVLLSLSFSFLLSSAIIWGIYEAITFNLSSEMVDSNTVYLIFFLLLTTGLLKLSFIFFCLCQGIFYFSEKEKKTAEGLSAQLENLGTTRRNVLQK